MGKINGKMRDIKSKNVCRGGNRKGTNKGRKTEIAKGVHVEGDASDNRSS